jgi:SAM-dependent methyltransferase
MSPAWKQLALRLPLVGSVLRMRHELRSLLSPGRDHLRPPIGRLLRFMPLFVAEDRRSFLEGADRTQLAEVARRDAELLQANPRGRFHLRRFCLCCNRTTRMLVDHESCLVDESGKRTPNLREQLVCSHCGMNNRQRLVARLVQQAEVPSARRSIYLMEQVSPIFEWVKNLPGTEVHGSEYLGFGVKGGERIRGIRHQDVMNLSYPDESFDLIVSNDLLEHIPDPAKAFSECFRVLKPGGEVLATFPFHVADDTTRVRARLEGGSVEHLLPPQYHGNPVSPAGSLVFHDFGWDLLDVMRGAGFSSAACEVYASNEFGHLGAGPMVFRLRKSRGLAAG